MGANDRHVVLNADGGWDVVKEGNSQASAHTDTEAQAIDREREIVHDAGDGELLIRGTDGQTRAKDTIAPRNDPRPSKG
jgi:hypothetical protein